VLACNRPQFALFRVAGNRFSRHDPLRRRDTTPLEPGDKIIKYCRTIGFTRGPVNGFVVQRWVSDMVTNRIGAVADEGPFGLKSMVLVE
jgi:hypothetical protein